MIPQCWQLHLWNIMVFSRRKRKMCLQPSRRTGYWMLQKVKLVMLGSNIIPELVKGYKDFTEWKHSSSMPIPTVSAHHILAGGVKLSCNRLMTTTQLLVAEVQTRSLQQNLRLKKQIKPLWSDTTTWVSCWVYLMCVCVCSVTTELRSVPGEHFILTCNFENWSLIYLFTVMLFINRKSMI